jgi:hypothetical protein
MNNKDTHNVNKPNKIDGVFMCVLKRNFPRFSIIHIVLTKLTERYHFTYQISLPFIFVPSQRGGQGFPISINAPL